MITIDRQKYKEYKEGIISKKQFAEYLYTTFPASEIAMALVECMEVDLKPITITQEEFNTHFRIKGIRPDGSPETRGSHRKNKEL